MSAEPAKAPAAEPEKRRFGTLTPDERVKALEQRVRVRFEQAALAQAAVTHTSFCHEQKDAGCVANERLEFLGDAVVNLVVGQRLMERFPQAHEGELSKLRALIVNAESLGRIARDLGLGELLLLGRGEERTGGRDKSSVLADALEAVAGAIYLSNGMAAVLEFIDRSFADAIEGAATGRQGQDSKSRLQVEVQARLKQSPRYRVAGDSGPDHDKTFEVEVSVGGEVWARSTGHSKKEAEQAAARVALEVLEQRTGTAPAPAAEPPDRASD